MAVVKSSLTKTPGIKYYLPGTFPPPREIKRFLQLVRQIVLGHNKTDILHVLKIPWGALLTLRRYCCVHTQCITLFSQHLLNHGKSGRH